MADNTAARANDGPSDSHRAVVNPDADAPPAPAARPPPTAAVAPGGVGAATVREVVGAETDAEEDAEEG